jgi:hypothetical protein
VIWAAILQVGIITVTATCGVGVVGAYQILAMLHSHSPNILEETGTAAALKVWAAITNDLGVPCTLETMRGALLPSACENHSHPPQRMRLRRRLRATMSQ